MCERDGRAHTVGERRWTTPELLRVEQRLLESAVGRAAEQVGVCSPDGVRDALAAHPSIGADQEAMVRDLTQGGAGVQVRVGRAGTGKTFALGWLGTPGSWTATESLALHRPGSPPSAWAPKASSTPAPSTGCWPNWTTSATSRPAPCSG